MMKTMWDSRLDTTRAKRKWKNKRRVSFLSSQKYTLKYLKVLEHAYNLLSNDSEKNTYREIYVKSRHF